MYCGGKGHVAADCKKWASNTQGKASTAETPKSGSNTEEPKK